MKLITPVILLITLSFELAYTKQFEICEFVRELYHLHEIPREDIYKHMCIAQSLHTGRERYGFLGIYGIGSAWWCKDDAPGGSCNMRCSNLLDDNIADDVECANFILSTHGFSGWQVSEDHCRSGYEKQAKECLAQIDVLIDLNNGTTTQSYTSTTNKVTTTYRPTLPQLRFSIEKDVSSSTTTEKVSKQGHQMLQPVTKCSCRAQNIFITIIALILLVLLIIIVAKYQQLKRYLASKNRDFSEFENSLVI